MVKVEQLDTIAGSADICCSVVGAVVPRSALTRPLWVGKSGEDYLCVLVSPRYKFMLAMGVQYNLYDMLRTRLWNLYDPSAGNYCYWMDALGVSS